jgi:WD40 repeat protein
VLCINPHVHSATIHRIAADSQGKYLLTASSDKTARLWDVTTGNCLKVFRPPIGAGKEGELFACALSPDGAIAAMAGIAGALWNNATDDSINIGDAQNRSKIARYSLYLFSSVSDEMLQSFDAVGAEALDLKFSPDGTKLVAALGNARGLLVFDVSNLSNYRKLIGFGAAVRRIAFSKRGEMAVIADDGMIGLYDANFELIRTKMLRGRLSDLAYSPDGNELAVAFADNTPLLLLDANTLDAKSNPVSADKSTLFSQITYSSDGALFAGGHYNSTGSYQIKSWKAGNETSDIKAATGVINNIIALADGSIVYTSANAEIGRVLPNLKTPETWAKGNHKGNWFIKAGTHIFTPETNSCLQTNANGSEVGFIQSGMGILFFSINERRLYEGESSYKTPTDRNTKHSIRISRWNNSPLPYLNSIAKSVFEKDEVGVCVDVAENGKVILMGTGKNIYALDRYGGMLWKRTVQGGVTAVKVSGNGRIAVATLGDGVLAWFSISDGEQLMTLFPDPRNRKWILWTPDGFYDCTAGADEFAGWHINRGTHTAADFYPLSRFRTQFYRPDIIHVAVTNILTAKELSTQVPDDAKRIAHILPPIAYITGISNNTDTTLQVNVKTLGAPPISLKIIVNGRPVRLLPNVKAGAHTVTFAAPASNCTISAIAANKHGAGVPATVVYKSGQTSKAASHVRILSVGVSEYFGELRLRYPAKDAVDFAAAMKQMWASKGEVSVETVVNEQVTKSAVVEALRRLAKESGRNDVSMIFMSGHFLNAGAGKYFFLPAECSVDNVQAAGVNFGEVADIISQIQGIVVLFLDASHSGYLSEIKSDAIFDVDGLVNMLASPETGATVFTSSTGRTFSIEKQEWGNGVFAKALIEGVRGNAFPLNSSELTATRLHNYIAARIKELTEDKMQPALVMPANVVDCGVGVR